MLVVENAFSVTDLPRGGVATIGNYDGIHRGQRATLERVVERARELGAPPIVVTFEPHPRAVLRPESAPEPLTTRGQKVRLLEEIGIEAMAVIRFTPEFARTSAEEFVRSFLHGALKLREIHVGSTFSFGRDREGDLARLSQLGHELGFEAFGVEEVLAGGERISSTRVRLAISEGRSQDAMELLGRPYSLAGTISRGDRMGQRIGWPTINVLAENQIVPADGVYAGRARFPKIPAEFDCATNIGTRPTVYENYQRVVESHVLDFKADVYGEPVEILFYKRLREERIFPSVMDLSAQIRRDVEATREYFSARRRLQDRAESDPATESSPLS